MRILCILILLLALPLLSHATAIFPAGLNPGDAFHFVFGTRDKQGGQKTLTFYNEFVNSQARLAGSLTESIDTEWSAIVSTPSVDARDNAPVGDNTPIYLLGGTLVVTGALDLWDGSILNPIDLNQFGDIVFDTVWTGSQPNGTGFAGRELGCMNCFIGAGFSTSTDATWITLGLDFASANGMSIYALSGVLTVPVPEPSTVPLVSTGFLGLVGYSRRKNKLHTNICPS